jgi:hypothetical protein
MTMRRLFARLFRHFGPPPRRRWSARPGVERLGARITPATTDWIGTTSAWNNSSNWDAGVPGSGDTAVLGAVGKTFSADPTYTGSTPVGALDSSSGFNGHTLTIGDGTTETTLKVTGVGGISGSWSSTGTIRLKDKGNYSIQGGADAFSAGNITADHGYITTNSGEVLVGGSATLTLGGSFADLWASVYVGFSDVGTNGTSGTLHTANNLSAPVSLDLSAGGTNKITVDGSSSALNIDRPSQNNDMGIKAANTACVVQLQNGGKETTGSGAVIAFIGSPTLWSPAIQSPGASSAVASLDCEYTTHIQATSSYSVILGDPRSSSASSYTQGGGVSVTCDGGFAVYGTGSFPGSGVDSLSVPSGSAVSFLTSSIAGVTVGTAGNQASVVLNVTGDFECAGYIYVTTWDGGLGAPPNGDTLSVSGNMTFDSTTTFTINGAKQWTSPGSTPWKFILLC